MLLDQVTKLYVTQNIKAAEPIVIIENFFEITHVLNPGAAFGFLADKSDKIRHPFFITVVSVAICFIIYLFFTLKKEDKITKIALCLILSGAIGNLIDRIRLKAVVDFIYVHYYDHYWPAFNVADAAITVGIFLMAIDIIIKHKREKGVTT